MDASEDEIKDPAESTSKSKGSRQSLAHILSSPGTENRDTISTHNNVEDGDPAEKDLKLTQESVNNSPEEEKNIQDSASLRQDESASQTVGHGRRNANGTVGSVYSGNKIRHLKKEDGIPLWRKDIQYAFLKHVFEDDTRCFTLEGDSSGDKFSFADIYINAMAKSSKTSKVLREKLLSDRESAQNMAMICLLVNIGRMNTTLNFFPEMRAQLRTYHSIPCLQVHQDANSQYKGLQDAPRLKSILKGSCEDADQPNSIEKIQGATIPRTNPVNLIFIFQQFAPKISEIHFKHPRDFFDLVIRGTLSSRSRAKAFLWLIWWYLEGDFSEDAALNNPFGAGVQDKEEPGSLPLKVPDFEFLTEEQATAENVDTEQEKAYGEKMRLVRKRILEEDETVGPPVKKPAGPGRFSDIQNEKFGGSPARSDLNRTRSPSPDTHPPLRLPKPRMPVSRDDDGTPRSDLDARQPRIKFRARKIARSAASSSPAPAAISMSGAHGRRARPETSHQKAVILNRKMRIESILYKKLVKFQGDRRRAKRDQKINRPYLAMSRIASLPDDYDSETELAHGVVGGLIPDAANELEDFGSEALSHRKVIDRAARRLAREETRRQPIKRLGEELENLLREDKIDIISPNDAPRRRPPGTRPRRIDRVGRWSSRRARDSGAMEEVEGAEGNRGGDDYSNEESGGEEGAEDIADDGGDDGGDDGEEDSDETIENEEEPGEWATAEV